MKKDIKKRAIRRLKILEGQIRGLQEMVDKEKYCIDILQQSSAAKAALSSIEDLIMENHLSTHVIEQIKEGKGSKSTMEIMAIYKLSKRKYGYSTFIPHLPMKPATSYSFSTVLPFPLSEADPKVRESLKTEGFGIISEIDIAAKLREKLGIEHPPHLILGACNPKLAHQALKDNPDVALALPCNVVLREENGETIVSALLPSVALKPFGGANVKKTACTAEEALARVFDALSA